MQYCWSEAAITATAVAINMTLDGTVLFMVMTIIAFTSKDYEWRLNA